MRTDVGKPECEFPVPFVGSFLPSRRIAMLYLINDEGIWVLVCVQWWAGEKIFDSGVQGPKMVTGGWVGKISPYWRHLA